MSVSIVIPTYNAQHFISQTLESVALQSFKDWELILVDDGSKDGTLQILRDFAQTQPGVTVLASANGGESVARNRGFAATNPNREYVIFLDHDDVWLPDALDKMVRALRSDSSSVAVHGLATMVDQNTEATDQGFLEEWGRRRKRLEGKRLVDCAANEPTVLSSMVFHICVSTMGLCLIRRSAITEPVFDIRMKAGGADYKLYLQLLQKGDFLFIDEVLIKKRKHASNITNDQDASQNGLLTALLSVRFNAETDPDAAQIMDNAYHQKIMMQASEFTRPLSGLLMRLRLRTAFHHVQIAMRFYRVGTLQKLRSRRNELSFAVQTEDAL